MPTKRYTQIILHWFIYNNIELKFSSAFLLKLNFLQHIKDLTNFSVVLNNVHFRGHSS